MKEFYQLLDKSSLDISPIWSAIPIGCMTLVATSSFASSYCFGKSLRSFGYHCFLNAKLTLINKTTDKDLYEILFNSTQHNSTLIDVRNSEWGEDNECMFCQFTPLMSMISAIVWAALFKIFSRGGAGFISDKIYRPWRIVLPALIFSIIAVILLFISTCRLSQGIANFCSQFQTLVRVSEPKTQCSSEVDIYTLTFYPKIKQFAVYLGYAIFLSHVSLVAWLLHIIGLILRIICVVDFYIVKVNIVRRYDLDKKMEEVETSSEKQRICSQDARTSNKEPRICNKDPRACSKELQYCSKEPRTCSKPKSDTLLKPKFDKRRT